MSKAAENLAARAARAARRTEEASTQQPPAKPRAPKPQTAKVRITLDLAPLLYRTLQSWCADAARQLDVAKVPAADVLRALIEQVDDDPQLAEAIHARLRAGMEK